MIGWLAATFAAAVILGSAVAKGELKLAILPVAALLAMVVAGLPVAGYVAILWSVGTAIDIEALPEIGAASLRFMPAEIILWIVVGCLALFPRNVRRSVKELAAQRESLVMGAFIAALLGGVAAGVENGASLHAAVFDVRTMLFFIAFWPALAALTTNRQLVFTLVAAGAVSVVILQTMQVIIGPSRHLFLIASADLAGTLSSDGTGFLRVRPPGLTTIYIVAAFTLARVLWGPSSRRLLGWGMLAVMLTGITLSLNRHMVIGLVLGLSAAALVARQRHRVVVLAATMALVVTGFIIIAQSSASLSSNPVVSRLASIAHYSKLKTQTLDDRYYEDRIAWQRIRDHPVGGLGWGPDYGAVLLTSDDGFLVSQPRSFMHEQYLWIWMRAGIVGLLAIVASLVLGIWNGTRWFRARGAQGDAWIGAGVVVSLVAMAASANVTMYFSSPDSTVPLVGVLALAAVLRRDLGRQ